MQANGKGHFGFCQSLSLLLCCSLPRGKSLRVQRKTANTPVGITQAPKTQGAVQGAVQTAVAKSGKGAVQTAVAKSGKGAVQGAVQGALLSLLFASLPN